MQPEGNNSTEKDKNTGANTINLTEENTPVLLADTAEANEDDIEVIDVSEPDEK